jgi:hypothetical protein
LFGLGARAADSADSSRGLFHPSRVRALSTFGLSVLAEHLATRLEPGPARGVANLAAAGFALIAAVESGAVSVIAFASIGPLVGSQAGIPAAGFAALAGVFFGGLAIHNAMEVNRFLEAARDDFSR